MARHISFNDKFYLVSHDTYGMSDFQPASRFHPLYSVNSVITISGYNPCSVINVTRDEYNLDDADKLTLAAGDESQNLAFRNEDYVEMTNYYGDDVRIQLIMHDPELHPSKGFLLKYEGLYV